MSSAPPQLIADRYRLMEPLGQGGMGRVWKARDEVLHRDVAIKELVPPPGLTEDERREMRERSLREARAIARLNHANVVRVFDVLRTDGDPWIVMEYVPSRSLQDVLASDGPVPAVRAAQIGLGVLGALKAAHRAGVMHRDVKPGNVLLGDDGRVVLTDFGLATVPGDPNVTRTGLVLGSPAYIAPERAKDGTAGPEGDLWSLGATLYAAVEGQSPFARPSAIATLAALATEPPPAARRAGQLKAVLNGLLRKDPTTRINAEVAERLLRRAAGRRNRPGMSLLDGVRRPSPLGSREPREPRTGIVPLPVPRTGQDPPPAAPPPVIPPDPRTAKIGETAPPVAETTRIDDPAPPVAATEKIPVAPPGDTAPVPAESEVTSAAPPAGETVGPPGRETVGPPSGENAAPGTVGVPDAAPVSTSGSDTGSETDAQAFPDRSGSKWPAPSSAGDERPASSPGGSERQSAVPAGSGSGAARTEPVAPRPPVTGRAPLPAAPPADRDGSDGNSLAALLTGNRRVWLLGGLVAVLLLALVVIVPLVNQDRDPAGNSGAGPGVGPTTPPAATPPAAETTAPPTPAGTTAAPTRPAATQPGQPAPTLPSGWRLYQDRTGFSVPVPADWTVSRDSGGRVLFNDPDSRLMLLIDQTDSPRPDPVADWKEQERIRKGGYAGYRRVTIQKVDYWLKAADWEWIHTVGGTRMHVRNRGFVTAKDKAYAIRWDAPAADWDRYLDEFQVIADGFRPVRG